MNKMKASLGHYFKKTFNKVSNNCANDKEYSEKQHSNVELELIEGIHANSNKHQSIIHFSFNKAATQYIKSILTKCATNNGMTPVGFNEYAFNTDLPFLDHLTKEEMRQYKHIFKPLGYVYTVFGGMVDGIDSLQSYKVILAVRDPRDILVSSYYSQAFSHVVPDENGNKYAGFMYRREFAQKSTIDDYVLWESDKVNNIFLKYNELLLQKYSKVHVARYEDMVDDFSEWLKGLIDYCELTISDEMFALMVAEYEHEKPVKEDINKHLRKGIVGDYKEKLQPDTVLKLNSKFSTFLETFGYVK